MTEWQIIISQDDNGAVTASVADGTQVQPVGRVPLWDGLPPKLLGGCVEMFARQLCVDSSGNQLQ